MLWVAICLYCGHRKQTGKYQTFETVSDRKYDINCIMVPKDSSGCIHNAFYVYILEHIKYHCKIGIIIALWL